MRNIFFNWTVSAVVMTVSFMATASTQASLQGIFSSAEVFSSRSKQLTTYEAIAGPILYIEGASSEGYSVTKNDYLTGQFERNVFDFPASYSAQQLYMSISAALKRDSYEILYSCDQSKCGEILGWKLFLDRAVDGYEHNQFYVLAKKKMSYRSDQVVAIYINEFSNQPRVIQDRISNISIPEIQLDNMAGNAVYFPFSDDTLTPDQINRLKLMVTDFIGSDQRVDIIGFSDDIGSSENNINLSRRRALNVLDYLVQKEGIPSDRFNIIAMGSENPAAPNTDESNRALNRRVEIHIKRQSDS